ncbi:kelch-like protein 41a [Clavelina lepadiformis]|uniref:BTB domain-containing protein n=1 Tax=Clavelina lepadiformis TaxID=159417 RepID=A0ABP0GPI7_CLALP
MTLENSILLKKSSLILSALYDDQVNQHIFTDFVIKVEEKEFKVHKNLLGCLSNYFKTMFLSEMKEKQQNEATIERVSGGIMEVIIKFIYTNEDVINIENVYDLMDAADYFQIKLLQDSCNKYLADNLSLDNVVSAWQYAVKYGTPTLLNETEIYIAANFNDLVKNDLLLLVGINEITQIIKLSKTDVAPEYICQCIIRWVSHAKLEREKYVSQLIKHINLNLAPAKVMNKIVKKNDLLLQVPHFIKRVLSTSNIQLCSACSLDTSHQCVVIENKGNETHIRIFDAMNKLFTGLPVVSVPKMHSTVCDEVKEATKKSSYNTYSRNVCAQFCKPPKFVGVVFGDEIINALYDKSQKHNKIHWKNHNSSWSETECYSHEWRSDFACVAMKGFMYVTGGLTNEKNPGSTLLCDCQRKVLSTAKRCKLNYGSWNVIENMTSSRYHHALVVLGEKLYAIGGITSSCNATESVECFDDKIWKKVTHMKECRSCFAAVVLYGQIYAIGGVSSNRKATASVERFDPSTDTWCRVASMTKPRSGHTACVYDGKIYVVDGDEVEVYDAFNCGWKCMDDDGRSSDASLESE